MSHQQDHAGPALRLLPFRAVRYTSAIPDLAQVLAPPYDVIDDDERADLEARDPCNAVHLILPRERETAGPGRPRLTDRYARAAWLFAQWRASGRLAADAAPALYVYQQRRNDQVLQRGLFGAVALQPLDGGVILPHERVRSGPVEDRLALMRAMRGNPEPIFLLYDGGGEATAVCAAAVATPPLQAATTPDGIAHELWAIADPALLETIAQDLATRRALIADGHHRYTTYGYLRDELRSAGQGSGPWDAGLALIVDESVAKPLVEAIHRVLPSVRLAEAVERALPTFRSRELPPGSTLDDALRELAAAGVPEKAADGGGAALPHAYVVTDGSQFVLLDRPDATRLAAARPADRTAAWWALDASVAAVLLMEQLWGVSDVVGQVEAEHDPGAAVRLARGSGGTALLLNPAPLAGIWAVAAAGDAMPRKSTLFLPKPRSGVVMRSFDTDPADAAPAGVRSTPP